MKLVKLLANLGYGSRKEVQRMIRSGAVTDDAGRTQVLRLFGSRVRQDGRSKVYSYIVD